MMRLDNTVLYKFRTGSPRGHQPCCTGSLEVRPLCWEGIPVCCLNHPACSILLREALATHVHSKNRNLIILFYCEQIIFLLILRMRRNKIKYQGGEEKKIISSGLKCKQG